MERNKLEFFAPETIHRYPKPRKSLGFSRDAVPSRRDDIGWLAPEDSNRETSLCKRPFEMSDEFRLFSEHIATRDFSPAAGISFEYRCQLHWLPGKQSQTSLRTKLWR
jgi:hypothetical protein